MLDHVTIMHIVHNTPQECPSVHLYMIMEKHITRNTPTVARFLKTKS